MEKLSGCKIGGNHQSFLALIYWLPCVEFNQWMEGSIYLLLKFCVVMLPPFFPSEQNMQPHNTHTRTQKITTSTIGQWPEQSKSHTSQLGESPMPIPSACNKGCTKASQTHWRCEEAPSLPWGRSPLWDPSLPEEHWAFDQEGTLPASCPQDCLWNKIRFANAEHGPPCPPGGFHGIPCLPL